MDNNTTQLKYIGYARKSSEDNKERQAASLPDQIYTLEGIKSKHNLDIVDLIQESKSAYGPGRELFNAMIGRIERGEANAILVWHSNRLARNMIDGGRLIYLMDTGKLVEIRTPSRSYHNTPDDKFMLSLDFSISKKDSDDKAIVVMRGLEKKARDGWRPGAIPQGYLDDKTTESGFRKIPTDPVRLPFVKKIFELFRRGTPVVEIHRVAEEAWHYRTRQRKRSGGKPISISMIYHLLSNPFYCGKFEYPVGSGKWYEGQHEKAVSEEVFDEIQVKLGRRSQYKLQGHEFAYTGGLVRCGNCGSSIVAEEKWQCICTNCKLKFPLTRKNREGCTDCGTLIKKMVNPKILHYIYYRCGRKKDPNCREGSIRIDRLEAQIEEKLSKIEISPLFMNWAIERIRKENEQEKEFREDTISGIKRAHDSCRLRLDNLLQLKISPENKDGGLLSDVEYRAQKGTLEKELKSLEGQLSTVDNRMLEANDKTERAFTFAARAKELFETTNDLKVKRDIFMGFGLNLTLKDRIVQFNGPEYLVEIEKMKKEAPIIAKRVEPGKEAYLTTKIEEKFASIPTVLRGLQVIRTCFLASEPLPERLFIPDLR